MVRKGIPKHVEILRPLPLQRPKNRARYTVSVYLDAYGRELVKDEIFETENRYPIESYDHSGGAV